MGPTSAVETDTSSATTTSTRPTVARWSTPSIVARSRPSSSTSRRRRSPQATPTAPSRSTPESHTSDRSKVLKLANIASWSTWNSLGSMSRCMKLDSERKNTPSTIPASTSTCTEYFAPASSQRYSSTPKVSITAVSRRNFAGAGIAVMRAAPIENTRLVWSSRYSASKPMIDGVRMRLSVTVWNITVETATATPTSVIASSLVPRKGSTKSHEPFAPTVMNATAARSTAAPSPTSTHVERRSRGAGASSGGAAVIGGAPTGGTCPAAPASTRGTSPAAPANGTGATAAAVRGPSARGAVVGSGDTGTSPQQEGQEQRRADHADDDADRHLVRVAHRAAHEVAHEHERGPAE